MTDPTLLVPAHPTALIAGVLLCVTGWDWRLRQLQARLGRRQARTLADAREAALLALCAEADRYEEHARTPEAP